MRVQATKKMANELNKAIKGTRFENMMHFSAREMTSEQYSRELAGNWLYADYDYNARTGKYRTMRVAYNPNLYAMGQYITGYELVKIFKRTGNNWDDFVEEVFEQYEI